MAGYFTTGTLGNDGGFKDFSFGSDAGGFFVTGKTIQQAKNGAIIDQNLVGKKYLGKSAADLTGNVLTQYNNWLNPPQGQTMTFDNPTMGSTPQKPSLLGSSDPSLNGPSSGGAGKIDAGGTGGSSNLSNPSPQVNTIQGAITTTIADSPTQAPVAIPGQANMSNSLDPNNNPLNPNKIKKGLTAGQGLASTKGAGELMNPALVARKSLLAG